MSVRQTTEPAAPQVPEPAEAEALRAEIRQDMRVLASYVVEHGDPAAELRGMVEAPDAGAVSSLR